MEEFSIFDTPLEKALYQIEANAGTGKTYMLENVCMRLVKEKKIPPEAILILTFSNQAVAELKKRIGKKFIAASCLDAHDGLQTPTLEIYTFHAFFYKLINELGFFSSFPPYDELTADHFPVFRRLAGRFVEDFMYPSPDITSFLLNMPGRHFRGEDALIGLMSKLYGLMPAASGGKPNYDGFHTAVSRWHKKNLDLRDLFVKEKKQFIDFLSHPENINRRALNKTALPTLIEKLDVLPTGNDGETIFAHFNALFPEDWVGKKIKNIPAFQFEFFQALDAGKENYKALTSQFYNLFANYIGYHIGESAGSRVTFDLLQKSAVELSQIPRVDHILKGQYQAVLVDEYQDTDIFQQTFLQNLFFDNEHYVFLVGDTKQSIYQFRGANFFSETSKDGSQSPKIFSLSANYRSRRHIVETVNTIFDRRHNPFFYESFIANKPSSLPEKNPSGETGPGSFIVNVIEDGNVKTTTKSDHILRTLRYRIERLMATDRADTQKKWGDIAILVRKNHKAKEINRYLSRHNIPSYLFTTENIFATKQAKDVHSLMCLINNTDVAGFRSYLFNNELMGYTQRDMCELEDERTVESIRDGFYNARLRWQTDGISAAFDYLNDRFNIFLRLVESENGVRKYGNYVDIVEHLRLREVESRKNMAEQIIAYKTELGVPEYKKTKQDNSYDAVQIYTVHASKGLEFAHVFIPLEEYAAKSESFSIFHDPSNTFLPTPVVGEGDKEHHKNERLAEEIRILYVAITRASRHCELIFNASIKSYRSILDRVMSENSNTVQIERIDPQTLTYAECDAMTPNPVRLCAPKHFSPREYEFLVKKSFSSLTSAIVDHADVKKHVQPIKPEERELYGPNFGNVIHELIEKMDWQNCQVAKNDPALRHIPQTYGLDDRHLPYIFELAGKPIEKKLTDTARRKSFQLCQIPSIHTMKELMFSIRLNACDFKRALRPEDCKNPVSTFVYESLNRIPGNEIVHFLDGFVDAVVEADGMLYIFDWKTNYLGDDAEHYSRQNMEEEMRRHHYHVQAIFYALALNRYLSLRLGSAPFDAIFGGIFYLFVRGIEKGNTDNGVYFIAPETIRPVIRRFSPYLVSP